MNGLLFMQLLGALALVILLLLLCAAAIKLVSHYAPALHRRMGLPHHEPRLQLRASLSLGPKARLCLVQCDDQEHLLLIGAEAQVLEPPKAAARTGKALDQSRKDMPPQA